MVESLRGLVRRLGMATGGGDISPHALNVIYGSGMRTVMNRSPWIPTGDAVLLLLYTTNDGQVPTTLVKYNSDLRFYIYPWRSME